MGDSRQHSEQYCNDGKDNVHARMPSLIEWLKMGGLLIILGIAQVINFALFWLVLALGVLIGTVVIGGTCYLIDLV